MNLLIYNVKKIKTYSAIIKNLPKRNNNSTKQL